MEDGGPIFYKHQRVRESGKGFNCLKFRNMHVNADQKLKDILKQNPALQQEWEQTYKLRKDPRITKTGRILRKTSLDELPHKLIKPAKYMWQSTYMWRLSSVTCRTFLRHIWNFS